MAWVTLVLLVSLLGLASGQGGGGSGQVTSAPSHQGGHGTGGGHGTTGGHGGAGGHGGGGHGSHFDYSRHGQDWKSSFTACKGRRQSPINLPKYPQFKMHSQFYFRGFNKLSDKWTLVNNGHSAKVTPQGHVPMEVSGGGLYGTYVVDQFHFHWPSEHTVNNMHYPMEMHVVTHNKKYADLKAALNQPDGLAVLGVFFEIQYSNPHFESLVRHLNMVHNPGATTSFHPDQALSALLPDNLLVFDRYQGSLTTPPCSETVTWSVFYETVKISSEQMDTFRTALLDSNYYTLGQNYRNTQPLNGRAVMINH